MNIKISYSPYQLKPQHLLNSNASAEERSGFLLKVEWPEDGRVGYADLHPWTELGDASIEDQMSDLRLGRMSSQIEQSVWLADRDAHMRKEGRGIFDSMPSVRNNFIVTDFSKVNEELLAQLLKQQFTSLKVKVGRDLAKEARFVNQVAAKGFSLRLDFNAAASLSTVKKFIHDLNPSTLSKLEYIEDPIPFDMEEWALLRQLVPLALDNQFSRVDWSEVTAVPFDVLIVKPAKIDVSKAVQICQQFKLRATVTSYMDHPVGVMHALGIAMDLKKKFPNMMNDPGCLTHTLYQMDSFSAAVTAQGPYFMGAKDVGIGFTSLLEKLTWYKLKTF